MTGVLLDTHVLVWLVAQPERLGRKSHGLIERAQLKGHLHVAAITFSEIAMLAQRGAIKLRCSPNQWRADVLKLGVQETSLDGRIAIRATEVMDFHPDPADRMIVATALELSATLITADGTLLAWRSKLKRHEAAR